MEVLSRHKARQGTAEECAGRAEFPGIAEPSRGDRLDLARAGLLIGNILARHRGFRHLVLAIGVCTATAAQRMPSTTNQNGALDAKECRRSCYCASGSLCLWWCPRCGPIEHVDKELDRRVGWSIVGLPEGCGVPHATSRGGLWRAPDRSGGVIQFHHVPHALPRGTCERCAVN